MSETPPLRVHARPLLARLLRRPPPEVASPEAGVADQVELSCHSKVDTPVGAWPRRHIGWFSGSRRTSAPPTLDSLPLLFFLRGEEQEGRIAGFHVTYLDSQQREKYRLHIGSDGRLYDAGGQPFDTRDARNREGAARAMYTFDRDGRLYASKHQEFGLWHHSTLIGGERSAAAGEMEAIDGYLTYIDRASRHYLTTTRALQRALRFSATVRGLDVSHVAVVGVNSPLVAAPLLRFISNHELLARPLGWALQQGRKIIHPSAAPARLKSSEIASERLSES